MKEKNYLAFSKDGNRILEFNPLKFDLIYVPWNGELTENDLKEITDFYMKGGS